MLYVVLLHDFHLGKLMLIDESLLEHGVRNQWKCAVLTSVKHLNLSLERLLSQSDRARILRVLPFVETDFQGTFVTTSTAAIDVRDALVLLISDSDRGVVSGRIVKG